MTVAQEQPGGRGEEARLFVVLSDAGPRRDLTKGSREQAHWDAHAAFIDRLVDEGFIALGGPFADDGGAMLVVRARDEAGARARLRDDPWYAHGLLTLVAVRRWDVFIDQWSATGAG